MAKKKENTDNKEVLGENKENSAAKTADAGAENGWQAPRRSSR